jgi:hypothetical protein
MTRAIDRLLLPRPDVVADALARIASTGRRTPNLWQVELGVLRMLHRVLFRSETIGTCAAHPVRDTWRARLLAWRPLRFPFLLRERAIAPLDYSGLASPPERVHAHLLGAHHDGAQFAYDLEMLALTYPEWIAKVRDDARAITLGRHPRAEWLRDLCVYERYHEELLAACEAAPAGDLSLSPRDAADPDIAFGAYLDWCARQPATPSATLARWLGGTYSIAHGLEAAHGAAS